VTESNVSFIAQIRSSGVKGKSLILTIPKEVVEVLELKEADYAKFTIEKIAMSIKYRKRDG
jgi:antitoxin component of MazEF toxin-antitoxin module